jgi:hypothetical protein
MSRQQPVHTLHASRRRIGVPKEFFRFDIERHDPAVRGRVA